MRGGTHNTILTKFSRCEYGKKMPHFHSENPTKFHARCAMAHQQGFILVCTTYINVLELRHVKAHRSIEHMMHVAYTGKPMSLADMNGGNDTW